MNFDVHPDNAEFPAWVNSSAWNTLDLTDRSLKAWAAALAPAYLRIGGSQEDITVYAIGVPCSHFNANLSAFCLTESRLVELAAFANDAGLGISFGLNAMYGRNKSSDRFDPSQVEALFSFIAGSDHVRSAVAAFQFGEHARVSLTVLAFFAPPGPPYPHAVPPLPAAGNELEHQAGAVPYAADLVLVRSLLDHHFPDSASRPLLVAPDENPDPGYITDVFDKVPHGTADAVTWHQYTGYGLDPELQAKMMTASFYDSITTNGEAVGAAVRGAAPSAELWVGETALAWHSGQNGTTNAFYSSLWYTIQLGQLAWTHTVQCRQTFMGGYYELVDKFERTPNPDAWLALLWKATMGTAVLQVDVSGGKQEAAGVAVPVGTASVSSSPDPHSGDVYAFMHCLPGPSGAPSALRGDGSCAAGFGLAAVSLGGSGQEYTITVTGGPAATPRNEFHFAPADGETLSTRDVAVNGEPLEYKAGSNQVEPPKPRTVTDPSQKLVLKPRTVLFVQFPESA